MQHLLQNHFEGGHNGSCSRGVWARQCHDNFSQLISCISQFILCDSRRYLVQNFRREYIPQSLVFSRTDFGRKQEHAIWTNERLQQKAQTVLDVIENPDIAQALWQDKNQNLQYLKDNYDVSFVYTFSAILNWGFFFTSQLILEQITALNNFGHFQYTYGNYSGAADYLYHFCVLSTDNDPNTSVHWVRYPHRKMDSKTSTCSVM